MPARYRGGGGQAAWSACGVAADRLARTSVRAHGTGSARRTGHDRSPLRNLRWQAHPHSARPKHTWRSANAASVMSMDGQATAARLLVQCLQNEGVTVVFGIPGEENIRFTRALDDSPIRYVLTRHEQAAAFMAEMYGRVTGQAAVVSATLGPGAINLQLGVADAHTNSTPMVAISAQVGSTATTRNPTSSSTSSACSRRSPNGPRPCPGLRRSRRWYARRSRLAETERPGAVYLAVPEAHRRGRSRSRPGAVAPQRGPTPRHRRRHRWPRGDICCGRAQPDPAGRARRRPRRPPRPPWPASPRTSTSRSPPPSTARACSPTTTPAPSARSDSCAATTSTSASTTQT